ncbi:MAG: prepilin-type N-terminal cleavage/methylation domain-containing protein [Verrucomicrobiaceae bacterium]
MKVANARHSHAGFSLIELVTVLLILGVLVSVIVPHLGSEERRKQDMRNAQAIVHCYAIGKAARVPWPAGDVATVVSAVVQGRKPRDGAFLDRTFQAKVDSEQAKRTFRYLGRLPDGSLFFDLNGTQDPEGKWLVPGGG